MQKTTLAKGARNVLALGVSSVSSTLETSTGLLTLGEAGQERVEDLERSLHLVTANGYRVFR